MVEAHSVSICYVNVLTGTNEEALQGNRWLVNFVVILLTA